MSASAASQSQAPDDRRGRSQRKHQRTNQHRLDSEYDPYQNDEAQDDTDNGLTPGQVQCFLRCYQPGDQPQNQGHEES